MKVGQVTYCGNNYGSVLQCYATQQELEKRNIPCILMTRKETGIGRVMQSLEFRIDMLWKMLRYRRYFSFFCESLRKLKLAKNENSFSEGAQKAIDAFIQTNIRRQSCSWKEMKRISHGDEFSFFLSGSDQIWSAQWFITNRLWFLRFCPKEKRVAWMPSFGGEKLAEYNLSAYKKYISEYAYLSVREESGKQIIEDLLRIKVPVFADPVFLRDGDEWREIAAKNVRSSEYILMFFLDKPSELAMKQAKILQSKTNAEILYFAYYYFDPNGQFMAGGPEQFLGLIDGAVAVLTDSFHACGFSAILNTPFYAFARNSQSGAKQMSRIQNLLEKLALADRYITKESDCVQKLNPLPKKQVEDKLRQMRGQILGYLDMLLCHYSNKGE